MNFAKSAIAAILLAALIGPPVLLSQDAGPGRPDDVAELFPADAALFVEIVNAPKVLKDWREFVGALCTAKGKEALCKKIEDGVKPPLGMVPEKLMKDFENGFPTIQRLAAVLLEPKDDDIGWAVVATSSDAGFLTKIVEEDLRVFAGEEREHRGAKILAIRKLGEMKFDLPLFVTTAGKRLIVTTSWPTLCSILDRAAGKGTGGDLRQNRAYQGFSETTGGDPVFRGFASFDWSEMMGGGMGMSRRMGAHQMDEVTAIADFQKMRGIVLEATLHPGQIAARSKILIDTPCRIWDMVRQPAGPKDLLKYVPADAQAVAHANLKGGASLWNDILSLIRRVDVIEKKARKQQPEHSNEDEFRKGMERELGFSPEEAAAVVGDEVAGAMVGDDAFASERNLPLSYLVLVRVTDVEKAKTLMEKLVQHQGGYEVSTEDDIRLYTTKAHEPGQPNIAIHGSTCLLAGKAETLRLAVKAYKGDTGFLKKLPKDAASASQLLSVKHGAVWQLVTLISGGRVPDLSQDIDLEQWTTVLIGNEKEHLWLRSTDAGPGFVVQTSYLAMPVAIFGLRTARMSAMRMARVGTTAPTIPATLTEPALLPADKLAEEVKKHIEGLRSDDLDSREGATASLRALGKQAIPHVVDAYRKETDAEAKERLRALLLEWKAYDALPELLKNKAESFVVEFEKVAVNGNQGEWYGGFSSWPRSEGVIDTFPWGLEPYGVNTGMLQGVENSDVLQSPAGLRAVVEQLQNNPRPETQRQLAAVLAFTDASKAQDAVLAAYQAVADAETKTYLHIALGWSGDPKAREIVLLGFKDPDRWVQRASFLAAERSSDPALVPKLAELLQDADHETQWNASYTLRAMTKNGMSVNVYLPEDEFKTSLSAAKEWWEKNRGTFKVGK